MLTASVVLLSTSACRSQINNAKTETVKVYGNCGMCETAIEKAANKSKTSKADWNEQTQMATITYDSKKATIDAVLKSIALAGYDNEKFLAPDAAYNKLPGCCKYEREKKAAVAAKPVRDTANIIQNQVSHQHGGKESAAQDKNQLAAVFDSYFSLKDALVTTDGNEASTKAKDLQTAIQAVKMDQLPMEVHTVWMKVLRDLNKEAEEINGTKQIEGQRDHFMALSKNMYALIKVAKPAGVIYYQFCPMANEGKGANWLSKESGIKNPYYGSQMLTCGKTVETIK